MNARFFLRRGSSPSRVAPTGLIHEDLFKRRAEKEDFLSFAGSEERVSDYDFSFARRLFDSNDITAIVEISWQAFSEVAIEPPFHDPVTTISNWEGNGHHSMAEPSVEKRIELANRCSKDTMAKSMRFIPYFKHKKKKSP